MKQRYQTNGKVLQNVVIITQNVIIQRVKCPKNVKKVVLIGDGSSLTIKMVNKEFIITQHEPLDKAPDIADIRKIFNNCTDTAVFLFFFSYECQGLEQAGKDIADWLKERFMKKDITIIGHSKSGVCVYNLVKHYMNGMNVKLLTISTPFRGTPIASREEFKKIPKKFNFVLNLIHKAIFSGHNVDQDIAVGSNFLNNVNVEPLTNVKHINIVTSCSFSNIFNMCKDYKDIFCCLMAGCFNFQSDGIVPKESQKIHSNLEIEYVLPHNYSLWYVLENNFPIKSIIF